jgi:methionyl-tRNA formyltransferase
VTIIKMDVGMDTGPILAQQATPLETDDTTASLSPRLAEMGAQLLIKTLPDYLEGDLTPKPQPEMGLLYAPQLSKNDGRIDWTQPVSLIDRQVRAFHPWPGAFTTWQGQRLKILEILPFPDRAEDVPPGTVYAGEVCPMVAAGAGAAWLMRVQLSGKKALATDQFLCGRPEFIGAVLGE